MKEDKCEVAEEEHMGMKKCCRHGVHHHGGDNGAIYGLGVIGSLFYFLNGAVGLGPVLLGIGKAIFWPAFVVFKVLGILEI